MLRLLVLVVVASVSLLLRGQSVQLFTKPNFRDVLISCKNAEFYGGKASVEFTKGKYEAEYDMFGNLNKLDPKTPLGDFSVEYTYSVSGYDSKSAVGMTYMTNMEQGQDYFIFNYMLSPKGELWFYADMPPHNYITVTEKDYSIEPCSSIKQGEAINFVSVIRKGRLWYLIINSDTVKRITEPAYKSPDGGLYREEPAPLMRYYSNALIHKGKQKLMFISSSQTFFSNNKDLVKDAQILKNLSGFYSLSPDCKSGSSSYIFNIEVRYFQDCTDHKVLISGITSQPRYYYLKESMYSAGWTCDLNENDIIDYRGDKFRMKKLTFNPYSPRISFILEFRDIRADGYYTFECEYSGNKLKEKP